MLFHDNTQEEHKHLRIKHSNSHITDNMDILSTESELKNFNIKEKYLKLAESVKSERIQLFETTRQNVSNPIKVSHEQRQNVEETNKTLFNHQSRPPEHLDEDEYTNNGHKTRPPELNSDVLYNPNIINDYTESPEELYNAKNSENMNTIINITIPEKHRDWIEKETREPHENIDNSNITVHEKSTWTDNIPEFNHDFNINNNEGVREIHWSINRPVKLEKNACQFIRVECNEKMKELKGKLAMIERKRPTYKNGGL